MKLQVGAHFEITQLSVLEVIARYNFGTTGRRERIAFWFQSDTK